MPTINDATLILVAPCSLLLGAALQILIARLCSARAKGIVAALSSLPALLAVAGTVRLVQAGRAIDLNLLRWDGPLSLVLHVDALSVLFALMGEAWEPSCSCTPSHTWRMITPRLASTAPC